MRIQSLHTNFKLPTKGSDQAGAFDIYMPEAGFADGTSKLVGLGFASELPPGYVALLLPRSSAGAKFGVELNNTCGVIDSDYRGEWKAALKTKSGLPYSWAAGERLLQFMLVPAWSGALELVESVAKSDRGEGGFGSTGR